MEQLTAPSAPSIATRPFYIPSLDGLRAIAFLLVFAAHCGLDKIVPGGFGVTVFFFLSGFLITSLMRLELAQTRAISLRSFYVRRAFRILPPMYITLLVGYALGASGLLTEAGNLLGLVSVSAYFYNYTNLLHKPTLLPSGTGVLWSLMIEEHFYLLFPLAFKLYFTRRGASLHSFARWLLLGCGVALLWRCCLVFLFHTPLLALPRWTYNASDARFDAILFGCVLAVRNNPWFGDASPRLRASKGPLAFSGLLCLFASMLFREPHFRETIRYTLQSAALYPIFFYCVAAANQWQARWLEWKPLRYLGWVSYSMYLIHFVLLDMGHRALPAHPVMVAAGCFALALGYSSLMRVYIEQPSRHFRVRMEAKMKGHKPQALHLQVAERPQIDPANAA